MEPSAFTEMVGPPAGGRVYTHSLRPGLADCAPSGRIRLDALARWLQDVAYADVEDAGVAESAIWVVRRARMHVKRFPRFGSRFVLATFCSGLGRMWAERRTTITCAGASETDVEAVSLWVHLDRDAGRPSPLTAEELATYGDAAAGRRVTARLRHPGPDGVQKRFPWRFRATECDLAAHINNAAYWLPLEEEILGCGASAVSGASGVFGASGEDGEILGGPDPVAEILDGPDPDGIDVEIEYRTPAQPGEKVVLCNGARRWIVDEAGETHASILLARPSR
jgi:acyl-ACP thioesterase